MKNKNEEMTEILKELHELVPHKDGEATAIALGGDQLTVERAHICQDLRKHSFEPKEKLYGFVPFASDWHAEALLLQASHHNCAIAFLKLSLGRA